MEPEVTEVGVCEKHQRAFEAVCKDCEEPICASCAMFDVHLKHEIIPLEEGTKYLRAQIQRDFNKGLLKKEFSESHLLEIGEYNLRLEKYRNDTIKKLEDDFNLIINSLKKRKTVLMTEILEKFSKEKEVINEDEEKWKNNQNISEKILAISKDNNDSNVLLNAKFIMDGLKFLNEESNFRELKIYNVIDTNLEINNENKEKLIFSYEEILHHLKSFMSIEEPNILEFSS
jgi:hypothetical protein